MQQVDALPEPAAGEVRVHVLVTSEAVTDVMFRKGRYPDVKEKPPFRGHAVLARGREIEQRRASRARRRYSSNRMLLTLCRKILRLRRMVSCFPLPTPTPERTQPGGMFTPRMRAHGPASASGVSVPSPGEGIDNVVVGSPHPWTGGSVNVVVNF